MSLRFNRTGLLARFYMWLPPDDKQLPPDLCGYFWGLVGRIFAIFGLGGLALFTIVYWAIQFVMWLGRHKAGTFITFLVVLTLLLLIWLLTYLRTIKSPEILRETRAIIRGKIDAVKGRYCPRIEWR